MWEQAFDPSMLADSSIIINCPDAALAEDLMTVLAQNGVKWMVGETPSKYNARWDKYREKTCYWIKDGDMSYRDVGYAEEYAIDFSNYIKCTFFGEETPDFATASAEEICSLLGV